MQAIEEKAKDKFDLSIVLVGRNDDYGLGFLDRMKASVEHNRKILLDAGLNVEFIFVDWGFDQGRPLFAQMLKEEFPWWHTCIAVHPDWHEHLRTNPLLAFEEFRAKNVGVRRASSEFILATNCDIFFSKKMAKFLEARDKWQNDVLYRAVRIDLKMDVGVEKIDFDVLEHPDSISRVNFAFPPLYTNASGDFQMMSKKLWNKVRGFNEEVSHSKVHKDGNMCFCAHYKHRIPIMLCGQVYHLDHQMSLNMTIGKYGPNNELAPFGPNWNWETEYSNSESWGMADQPEKPFPEDDSVLFIDFPEELKVKK